MQQVLQAVPLPLCQQQTSMPLTPLETTTQADLASLPALAIMAAPGSSG